MLVCIVVKETSHMVRETSHSLEAVVPAIKELSFILLGKAELNVRTLKETHILSVF